MLAAPLSEHGFAVMSSSDFLAEATARGFVHQCTDLDGLDALLAEGRVTAYVGYDCTAAAA